MTQMKLSNKIDCTDLTTDEINFQIKDLIFNNCKNVILKNVGSKAGLLESISGNLKIEIIGDVGASFANGISEIKVVVNGNSGDDSACSVKNSKFTVFGSCANNFGGDAKSSEFYILEGCGKRSFFNLTNSKVILGGLPSGEFASSNNGGTIIILNLSGGNIFIEDDWFVKYSGGHIYLRGAKGEIKIASDRFSLVETSCSDEDIYLPLISEFARLFNYSLSEIKSKHFYRIVGAHGYAPS